MLPTLFSRSTPLACPLVILSLCGCGGKGDSTTHFDVSGTVTFDGKAVPSGTMLFEPDVGKGNRGPAGFAEIRDGKYDTAVNGKGTIGGPHLVRISGADKTPLFSEYVAKADLPKQKTTQNFDVPASAKAAPGSQPGANYQGP